MYGTRFLIPMYVGTARKDKTRFLTVAARKNGRLGKTGASQTRSEGCGGWNPPYK